MKEVRKMKKNEANHITVFNNHEIRRTFHRHEWYFVILDVIAVLSESSQPTGYLKDMRRRDPELSKGWGQIATPLPIQTEGGKVITKKNYLSELKHDLP